MWLFGFMYSCITTGGPAGAFEGKENDFNARGAVARFSPRGPVFDRIIAMVALGRAYPLALAPSYFCIDQSSPPENYG